MLHISKNIAGSGNIINWGSPSTHDPSCLFEEDKNMVLNQTVVIKIEDDEISSDSNTERAVNPIEEEQNVTRSG